MYLGRKKKIPSRSSFPRQLPSNKEGSPGKKKREDLRSPRTEVTYYPGGENTINIIPWDQRLPQELENCWKTWENNLPKKVEVPRSIVQHQETITSISLHAFGDASSQGVSTTDYAVMHQLSGVSQGLMTAKSRLAKKGLTQTGGRAYGRQSSEQCERCVEGISSRKRPLLAR